MPYSPSSQCEQPGCGVLAAPGSGGYCPGHRKATEKADRVQRGTSAQRGYDARHRRWRLMVLHRHPRCCECLRQGRLSLSTVADHIVPLDPKDPAQGDWHLKNGQGLCKTCHADKTAKEKMQ